MDSIDRLVLNSYTQALLIAREKGLRGPDARKTALEIVAHVVLKRTGTALDTQTVAAIVADADLLGDD